MIIIGTNEFIRRAAEWISSIDTPDQALVTEVVKLKYVKALEVQQILAKAYPPQFVSPLQDEYSLVITAPRSIADTLKEQIGKIDIPPVTMPSALIKMKHLQAEEVIKILPTSLKKYDIVLVKEQNGIMVTGPSDFIAAIKDYVAEIDLPNPLILFDILVVEYTERDSQKLGMSMGFKEGSTGIGFDFADEKALEPLWINVNPFASLDKEFNITLNTMIQNGSAKIKANPRISTLNGYEANFNVVTKSYYWDPSVNQDNNGSTTGQQQSLNDTLPSGAIRTIDTGVKIRLKPWVSASGDITIDIQPEISDSTGSGSDSGSLPQANERSARTTVRVKDGETIVIGGLIQSIKREEKRKVPILGDLPLIGSLFRSTSIVESESEFVIYITPHLIQDSGANPYMITPDTTTPGNPDDGTSIPALSGNDAEAKEDQVVK